MIRDTLDDNSAHAMIQQTGHDYGRVALQTRPTAGTWSTGMSKALYTNTKRVWLRIVKEGSKITGYYKNEGELVYQKLDSYNVEFTRDWYYVGIAVTSHLSDTLSSLEVGNFTISPEVFTLPARDVGDTGREIIANKLDSETWSIQGAGWDIGVRSIHWDLEYYVSAVHYHFSHPSFRFKFYREPLTALHSTTTSKLERT